MQADIARPWIWRVEHIPRGTTREQLKLCFVDVRKRVLDLNLSMNKMARSTLTRTFTTSLPSTAPRRNLLRLSWYIPSICVLRLIDRKSVIAVTGLAGHAFGSWMHGRTRSRTQMWLRDYLPKNISNIRVLIYGYPSELQSSISTISLFEHSNNFKERLSAMRHVVQVSPCVT